MTKPLLLEAEFKAMKERLSLPPAQEYSRRPWRRVFDRPNGRTTQLTLRRPGPDQRIDNAQFWIWAEIAVGRPQFAHAVLPAKSDNARVMNLRGPPPAMRAWASRARSLRQCVSVSASNLKIGDFTQASICSSARASGVGGA